MQLPIKFYSDKHKAFIPDMNRCPECGELLVFGASGRILCMDEFCSFTEIGRIKSAAMKLYFPNKLAPVGSKIIIETYGTAIDRLKIKLKKMNKMPGSAKLTRKIIATSLLLDRCKKMNRNDTRIKK